MTEAGTTFYCSVRDNEALKLSYSRAETSNIPDQES